MMIVMMVVMIMMMMMTMIDDDDDDDACDTLINLGASVDSTDDFGQKPVSL